MSVEAPEAPAAPPAEPAVPAAPVPSAPPPVPQQQAPAPPVPQQPPAAAPAAPGEPDWKAQAEAARAESDRLRAEGDRVKAEAARWKAQSRQQEARSKANHTQVKGLEGVVRQIAEKLEIPFDDTPDPEVLTRRLEEKTAQATAREVELAVYMTAADTGANARALLDSREFMTRTALLDPEAADFPSQVADLVTEAAKQPRYQFQQVPSAQAQEAVQQQPAQPQAQAPAQPAAPQPPAASSGADFSGAPGGNRLWTQADLDYWSAPGRDRDGSIISKAIKDGLLADLGVGKPKGRNRR